MHSTPCLPAQARAAMEPQNDVTIIGNKVRSQETAGTEDEDEEASDSEEGDKNRSAMMDVALNIMEYATDFITSEQQISILIETFLQRLRAGGNDANSEDVKEDCVSVSVDATMGGSTS